jgi:hypothetical protein
VVLVVVGAKVAYQYQLFGRLVECSHEGTYLWNKGASMSWRWFSLHTYVEYPVLVDFPVILVV